MRASGVIVRLTPSMSHDMLLRGATHVNLQLLIPVISGTPPSHIMSMLPLYSMFAWLHNA
jgi:hypothetical protein